MLTEEQIKTEVKNWFDAYIYQNCTVETFAEVVVGVVKLDRLSRIEEQAS